LRITPANAAIRAISFSGTAWLTSLCFTRICLINETAIAIFSHSLRLMYDPSRKADSVSAAARNLALLPMRQYRRTKNLLLDDFGFVFSPSQQLPDDLLHAI
jgi:hypothetical protein